MKRTLPYRARRRAISPEQVTFAIASLLVAILIGLILLSWAIKGDEPPVLSITHSEAIREIEGEFYVPFTLKNTGGRTAESVQVIGELREKGEKGKKGEIIETGDQQIDFLSGGEEEEAAFIFTQDPRQADLTLRVASYKLP